MHDEPTAPAPDDATDGNDAVAPAPSRRSITLSVTMLASAVLLAVLGLLPAPYAVSGPGPTRNTLGDHDGEPLITISGAETYDSTGELLLTTVSTTGGPGYPSNLVGVVRGWLDRATAVRPVEVVFPPDVSQDQLDQSNEAAMVSSQENATVSALEELGYTVPATLTIVGTTEDSGATGIVQEDDVLVAIDGTPLTTYSQLVETLAATEPGSTVRLGVLRDGQPVDLDVVTGEREGGGSQLGVFIDPRFDFPVDVSIKIDDIGGSSAGTMFALGIMDKLTPADEANGQVIAGTGTIDSVGEVGPIGGIQQKLAGAERDGATWFLAPDTNCDEVVGHVPDGLRVVKISTLHEAWESIIAIGEGRGDGLPTCTS
ncbi:PDZ domain-containing protein [Cellulomonas sp. P22]|uniref:PDZ domain-containing protein n=1 Tax=Cellulomonas sp. P22 TaxID=3373189 RepID=UPI0037A4E822